MNSFKENLPSIFNNGISLTKKTLFVPRPGFFCTIFFFCDDIFLLLYNGQLAHLTTLLFSSSHNHDHGQHPTPAYRIPKEWKTFFFILRLYIYFSRCFFIATSFMKNDCDHNNHHLLKRVVFVEVVRIYLSTSTFSLDKKMGIRNYEIFSLRDFFYYGPLDARNIKKMKGFFIRGQNGRRKRIF